ncbi:transcription factor IIIC subunit delta N-term-domain-containing protein [Dendryphion nanum]|uniref:Transcription factor IIIC subunit delta N-term-domain-containing protein n=1 Tax=Dendryphion nanum TaxID=256645 RepID=A0A9P9IEJ3_9PLEO|nr:transcription factor IIIC subunit delta N-term-domain-containing protein [Dendryphion nanum]
MSDVTELKLWPSCLFAIDWSHDGIIAFASDEQVELLFPSTESYDSEREIAQFSHFSLQVPWFTKGELPVKAPAPLHMYSIGEEISSSFAIGIAWSPPGVAKHRRCALATHTANLVLSIWASDEKPHDESSWDRRLIVNDALEEYFSSVGRVQENEGTTEYQDMVRRRRRIRTFAWAPSTAPAGSSRTVGTQTIWGQPMIVVTNDNNEVIIVTVNSPTSSYGIEETWYSEVLSAFSPSAHPNKARTRPHTFEEAFQEQRYVTHVAWGPWFNIDATMYSVLAYTTNEDIRTRVVSICRGRISVHPELILEHTSIKHAGPMKWSPTIGTNGECTLALFTATEVICLNINAQNASTTRKIAFLRDTPWDVVSGVAWDLNGADSPRLHFSPHTMTSRCPTVALELSVQGLNTVDIEGWPYWRDQILGSEGHFSTTHDLRGNANARVWGLSTSPLRDFMVACHTIHPTDMIEYGTPHDRRTAIAISHLWGKGSDLRLPSDNVSVEGIFFTVLKWIEHNVESSEEIPSVKETIRSKLIEAYTPKIEPGAQNNIAVIPSSLISLESFIKEFKEIVYFDQHTVKDRFEILASTICNVREQLELSRTLIAFRLAQYVHALPSALYENDVLSTSIFQMSGKVIRHVEALVTGNASPTSPPELQSLHNALNETCVFCDAEIMFEDLYSASCANGHEFRRCSLSFMIISGPKKSKYCGICNMPYLDETHLMASPGRNPATEKDTNVATVAQGDLQMQDEENPNSIERNQSGGHPTISSADGTQNSNQLQNPDNILDYQESPLTLANAIFWACDTCIYCGGKFIG